MLMQVRSILVQFFRRFREDEKVISICVSMKNHSMIRRNSVEHICGTHRAGSYDRHVDNRLALRVCRHVQIEPGTDR